MIDRAGNCRRAEAVIDVDDRDTRCAAVEHRQQGRDPTEAGAVANARWNGDDRRADEAADHTGEGALHARYSNNHTGGQHAVAFSEQTVEPGDADVVQPIDVVAHHLGGDRGFFGHGYVRSSCRGDQYDTMPPGRIDTPLNDPGLIVEAGLWYDLRNAFERCGVGAGDQQAVAAADNRFRNSGNLGRRLPLAVHDLGESLSGGAMVIDAGEAEILAEFERQPFLRPALGVGRIEAAVSHRVEESAKRVERVRGRMFLISQGFCLTQLRARP